MAQINLDLRDETKTPDEVKCQPIEVIEDSRFYIKQGLESKIHVHEDRTDNSHYVFISRSSSQHSPHILFVLKDYDAEERGWKAWTKQAKARANKYREDNPTTSKKEAKSKKPEVSASSSGDANSSNRAGKRKIEASDDQKRKLPAPTDEKESVSLKDVLAESKQPQPKPPVIATPVNTAVKEQEETKKSTTGPSNEDDVDNIPKRSREDVERELAEAKKIIEAKEAETEEERKKAAKAQAEAEEEKKKAADAQAEADKADKEKQRAADAQAEADKKAAEAQAKADEEKQKADAAKAEAEKVQTTHDAYKKRTAKERKETNEKLKTIEKEKETLRKQATKQSSTKQSSSQSSSSSTSVHQVYTEIVNAVKAAYKEAIEQKKAMTPMPTTFKWKFEFNDENNGPTTISDPNACNQLNMLMEGTVNGKVTYQFIPHVGAAQQSYTAELTKNHGEIKQINIGTNKERVLTAITMPAAQSSSSSSQVTGELSVEDKNDLMFGNAVVKLDFLKPLIDNIDKSDDDTEVIDSKELDDLADIYMSLSSNREHKNSKLFIKPAILRVWLAYAERYTHVRIVMHGAKKDAYKAIGIDRCGMDMQFGGSQGQAYGAGTYWSFSDHVTHHYNVDSKPGNCILGLLLCKEQIPDHARYTGPHHPTKGSFTTMQFHHYAIPRIGAAHNACVVHETPLTLLIGQLVPK